jgi:hypothetical protein
MAAGGATFGARAMARSRESSLSLEEAMRREGNA